MANFSSTWINSWVRSASEQGQGLLSSVCESGVWQTVSETAGSVQHSLRHLLVWGLAGSKEVTFHILDEGKQGYHWLEKTLSSYMVSANTWLPHWLGIWISTYPHGSIALGLLLLLFTILTLLGVAMKFRVGKQRGGIHKSKPSPKTIHSSDEKMLENAGGCTLSAFDLAKTAYMPGHTEALIELLKQQNYNINYPLPSTGLTLFLCACLSGQGKIVKYLLTRGANVKLCSKEGDSALYLATFGVLSTSGHDISLLQDLIDAGCSVNRQNNKGYTPLHRAASRGHIEVIKLLLRNGADPYIANHSGIYPIDSATNAGHVDAAEALQVRLDDPYTWDIVHPLTPPHIRLGLMSPCRKHLAESTAPCRSTKRQVFS